MKAYTDYPFLETDIPNKIAPIREITLISYDGDNYVTFAYNNKTYSIKAGYVYKNKKRIEKAKLFNVNLLLVNPHI